MHIRYKIRLILDVFSSRIAVSRGKFPAVTLNGQHIPQRETAKYLGIHFDRRLTWQKHIFAKR